VAKEFVASQVLARHPALLSEFAGAAKAFLDDLKAARLSDRVTLLAFSEFGRTIKENASGGTDHGAAAPHFVMGGKVKGGLHGIQPPLGDLQDGDLRHTVDFRDVYSTIARGCWGQPASFGQRQVRPLGFLAA